MSDDVGTAPIADIVNSIRENDYEGNFVQQLYLNTLANRMEQQAAKIAELEAQLKWTVVGVLTEGEGVLEVAGAEYPEPGIRVLVKSHSATGIRYDIHQIQPGRGNWSWPSFGVAWRYIEAQEQQK